jgi:Predicted GTPase
VKDADRETMKNLDAAAVSYQLLLTKTDQLRPADIPRAIAAAEAVARKHGAAHPEVLPTSSETGFGIPELRAEVRARLSGVVEDDPEREALALAQARRRRGAWRCGASRACPSPAAG